MTLTRKVGLLLLLLTAGSLAGAASFGWFFFNTTTEGLFLVAGALRHSMVQNLYIHAALAREGDAASVGYLRDLVDQTDQLIAAMEQGGSAIQAGTALQPISTATLGRRIAEDPSLDMGAADLKIAALLAENLPVPPEELRSNAQKIKDIWSNAQLPEVVRTLTNPAATAEESKQAFERLIGVRSDLLQASAETRALVMRRLVHRRERMVYELGAIATVSLALLVAGLWFTRGTVIRPIQEIEKASARVASGDYSYRIPVRSGDELGSLAQSFNAMAAEIRRQMTRREELFENAADGMFGFDLKWKITAVNKEAARLTGYSREELVGMKVDALIPPERLQLMREKLEGQIEGQLEDQMERQSGDQTSGGYAATTFEFPIRTKDGRDIVTECSARLVFEEGRPVGIQGVSRDITDRKRLQEQLWTAQKMDAVGRLASGIAHDFGNVLTVITGYSTLMLAMVKPGDPLRRDIEGIERSAQRAASMVRQLLSFSQGRIFRPKIINVEKALKEIVGMLSRLIGEDVRLETRMDASAGAVCMDPGHLEQIVVNLALNARDAMPNGGVFAMESSLIQLDGKPFVRIRVSDTGTGMPPDVLSRVFEPFYSTKKHGTGLGLATVQSMVRQSGGSLEVESHVGKGTTFSLLLPQVDADSDIDVASVSKRGSETILLVEDEPDVRMLIRDILRMQGYAVVEAEDTHHAVELCRQIDIHIDLMLTDVVMPGMSGPELTRRIQPMRPKLKVIYMSGHTRDRFAGSGIEEEKVHFIQKPVMPDTLASRIREVLDEDDSKSQEPGH